MSLTDRKIRELASRSHDEWRAPRLLSAARGKYVPRVKEVIDQKWIAAHGTTVCDIANTAYPDLPDEWQVENRTSAETAVALVEAQMQAGLPLDAVFVETAAGILHSNWVDRQPQADKDLLVPHVMLAESEKQKGRLFIRAAIAVCMGDDESEWTACGTI